MEKKRSESTNISKFVCDKNNFSACLYIALAANILNVGLQI